MADWRNIQEVRYGDLAAVYNDLPFTLTHWEVAAARVADPADRAAGGRRTYRCTGYIEAADAASLAAAVASAKAVLGADGGDFRVAIARKTGDPFTPRQWVTIEQMLSAGCVGGVRVEALELTPAGGCRIDVEITLGGWAASWDEEGLIWSSYEDVQETDAKGVRTFSAAGQVQVADGFSPREYFLNHTLPLQRSFVDGEFAPSQEIVRTAVDAGGRVCNWTASWAELFAGYADGVSDGERVITTTRDAEHGLCRRDSGSYSGPNAEAIVSGLVAAAPHAIRSEWSITRHKELTATWSVETLASEPGAGAGCTAWRERISRTGPIGGNVYAKEYGSGPPILLSKHPGVVYHWVQEGQAVSDDPEIFFGPPEKLIPGDLEQPADFALERAGRRQTVATWRYQTITLKNADYMVRPQTRDEGASRMVRDPSPLKLRFG